METGKTLFDGIQNRKQTIVNQITNGFEKAHVKEHTRTTKSGKMVEVKEHDDKRQKKYETYKNKEQEYELKSKKAKGKEKEILVDIRVSYSMLRALSKKKQTKEIEQAMKGEVDNIKININKLKSL